MIAVPKGDNLMRAGVEARSQERRFIGFGAGIGEVRLRQGAARRFLRDGLGEHRLRLGDVGGGNVFQRVDLLFHLLVHRVVTVPNANGDDPAEKVQILVAVGVPDKLVLGLGDDHRLAEIVKHGREDMVFMNEKKFLLIHVNSVNFALVDSA